ncbi:hypothetical protein CDD81_1876 [Ophiocordyceps australis]|uniref:Uncharacterized protein n=1 Tax=Ophiocordyceps australis TaxID=1399860 RepID=A0A2C5XXY5_9HYPO|nr:hypothetical protein CDD81_1876 [Ophiocordyceps australis]
MASNDYFSTTGQQPLDKEAARQPLDKEAARQPLDTRAASVEIDAHNVRACCHFGVCEYALLQQSRSEPGGESKARELEARIRAQAAVVVGDLQTLLGEVHRLASRAEQGRWRRWLLGGVGAILVPAVRHIFRRSAHAQPRAWANDTEYALHRSKSLLSRMTRSMVRLGTGPLARLSLVVFAAVYVFYNELCLRVARTLYRRVYRLCQRIQRRDLVGHDDVAVLEGWRWRVLL